MNVTLSLWKTAVMTSCLPILLTLVAAAAEPAADREPIGSVLGKTVYRNDIKTGPQGPSLESELHRLFTQPLLQKYVEEHAQEVTPTKEEIAQATTYFQQEHAKRLQNERPALLKEQTELSEQLQSETLSDQDRRNLQLRRQVIEMRLKPPGEQLAHFILDSWKLQKHLYDNYGGGRILWQQAGQEAFDAMHNWLKAQEAAGQFQITDPELRQKFYHYWTTQKHGAFLTDNKERIQKEFLEPPWMKPSILKLQH
ncbi:hypothetical protein GC163_14535 [bacterium]|nr:hypothetical protein [bacterium]